MVIREGGGCLAVFGAPFALAGVFLLLIGSGIVPLQNADEVPLWSWPVIFLMGLVFLAVGSSLSLGRKWTTLDRGAGSILKQWGLLVPMQNSILSLSSYDAVVIRFDRGDSDSADRYPVILRSRDGGETLTLYSSTDYAGSSTRARELAGFLGLPMEDTTTAHAQVYQADQLGQTFQEHLRGDSTEHTSVPRPVQLRSQVDISSGALRITLPGNGFRPATLLQFVIPLGILLYFAPSLREFFQQTDTPAMVQWAFLGFILIFFVTFPIIGGITGIIGDIRRRTQVTVAPHELVIANRGALRTHTIKIPAAEMLGLDYATAGSLIDSARQTAGQRVGTTSMPQLSAGNGAATPWWLNALSAIARSKGITVKSRQGLFTFGAGLPDDELRYLWAIISSTLAGRDSGGI